MTSTTSERNAPWHISACDLQRIRRLAELLALVIGPGDCICLNGDLGAGKTTFATHLLQAYASDDALTVPSPTFTLVERYDFSRGVVHHADLYRIEDETEVEQLGLDEARDEGALIVEWSERAPDLVEVDHLSVRFETTADDHLRDVTLVATPPWQDRLARITHLDDFLSRHTSAADRVTYLQGDASTRRYATVTGNAGQRILMDSPAQPDGPPVQDGKPYSAIAHLAEDVIPFVAIARALHDAGLAIPEIYETDLDAGILLTQHLGDRVFGREIAEGANLASLYRQATDVLLHLRQVTAPEAIKLSGGETHRVPDFDLPAFLIEARLLTDWYIPAVTGAPSTEEQKDEFESLFTTLFKEVHGDSHWILRDFHSPNLILRPQEIGIAQVGVIDFQDAMRGSAAYDLVSLLQDARLDVPEAVETELLDYYCIHAARAGDFDETSFRRAYAILGAQRNTKILGIFARLARRDGKPDYLAHIPRIWGYLERNLRHDTLRELNGWYTRNLPNSLGRLSDI